MYKLDLDKEEEPEIKLPTSIGSKRKTREFQKNLYFCFIDFTKAFDWVDHNKLWKILKAMGIPDHLTCLLIYLYADQEATVRTRHQQTGSQLVKEYVKAVYCHPAYLTYMQSVCMLSPFSRVQLFVTPWTVACQSPLSMGILQARILEWISMPSSRGSSWPGDQTCISCLLHWQVASLWLEPSMQSTSCEILGWMTHELESRLLGEISTTSDIQMIPL